MLNRNLARIVFYLVVVVLFTWTASLTVSFIQNALPDAFWLVPFLGLVVFDGGLLAWMIVFLSYAEGGIQRATALILTIFNLIGVGLMVVSEILLDGQQLTAAPEALGTIAIWSIGIWTIANVAGVVMFHLGDNEARKEMAIQAEKDAVFEGALKELQKMRAGAQAGLARELSSVMFSKMVADLHADHDGDGTPDILQRGRQTPSIDVIPLGNSTHPPQAPVKPNGGPVKPLGGVGGDGEGANFP